MTNPLSLFDDVPVGVLKPLSTLPERTSRSAVVEDGQLVVYVPISRLRSGNWDHTTQKTTGEGDIGASYSADLITNGKVRKPFSYDGRLMINTGGFSCGDYQEYSAYELIPVEIFQGTTYTYSEKSALIKTDADRQLFYHGMRVDSGGKTWVMSGPSILFKPSDIDYPSRLCR